MMRSLLSQVVFSLLQLFPNPLLLLMYELLLLWCNPSCSPLLGDTPYGLYRIRLPRLAQAPRQSCMS